jgi:hypothetical protein
MLSRQGDRNGLGEQVQPCFESRDGADAPLAGFINRATAEAMEMALRMSDLENSTLRNHLCAGGKENSIKPATNRTSNDLRL